MKTLVKILVIVCLPANAQFINAETKLDFDGDGRSDFAVHRDRTDGSRVLLDWYIAQSRDNALRHAQWGLGGLADLTVPADYDGGNKTDIAVWRSSETPGGSAVYILNSFDSTIRIESFGQPFDNAAAVGDYDGDGRTDFCVRRANGGNFEWYILERDGGGTGANPIVRGGGAFNDFAFGAGDHDGDGKSDIGVYRLGTNPHTFFIRSSGSGAMLAYQLGAAADLPVQIY
jgi:hypothetical protein